MRIIVSRSGGITGIAVRWVVDLGDDAEHSDWVVLIEACPWDDEPDDLPAPDRFVYLIRANGRRAALPEQQVRGPWRELVDRVRAVSAPERGRSLEPLDVDVDVNDPAPRHDTEARDTDTAQDRDTDAGDGAERRDTGPARRGGGDRLR